jgi:radical SAM protein with 4Fe4S-binding SPASM domain
MTDAVPVFLTQKRPQLARHREMFLPRTPKLHRFERDGAALYYNAFTHRWVRSDGDREPSADALDELAAIDWEFMPLSALEDPHLMRVEVTQECNFRCTYCIVFENDLDQLYTHMSTETAEQLLAWYHERMPGGTVMLIGGEPTLNWDVCEIFLDGVPRSAGKELYTNGVLLSDQQINWLAERNVSIRLSIDGLERHHAQRINRAGKTMYTRIVDRLRAMQAAGADVCINCTVTPANVNDLVEIHHYLVEELDVHQVNYSIPHMTTNSDATVGFDMRLYTAAMLEIYEHAKRNHVVVSQIMKRLAYLVRERFKAIGCTVIGPEVTFYPDGKQTLCTKLDSHPITADVRPDDIYESLPFFMDDCRQCPAIGVCGGGCYWDAKMRFDRFQDLRECDFQQQLVERMLWDVAEWSLDPRFPANVNDVFGTTMFQ